MTVAMDRQFLEDIIQHPADDGLRLIYDDWPLKTGGRIVFTVKKPQSNGVARVVVFLTAETPGRSY